MDNLFIPQENKTPLVQCNYALGQIQFNGRSIPENSIEFYEPVFKWIDNYVLQPQKETQVNIHLEYFNTSTSKCLLDIFKKLYQMHQAGTSKVLITWIYEEDDEDMLEAGEDYQALIMLPFAMKKVST
ncbi:MAG: DUF1987 domain-containing protein [Bacteroidia bacterium]|nr:DUF1987 domain-containing protein [Bacteroidia bacterium]MCC6769106.1 DUF1987 domain-containing protein [Bacteroidia bacterium]